MIRKTLASLVAAILLSAGFGAAPAQATDCQWVLGQCVYPYIPLDMMDYSGALFDGLDISHAPMSDSAFIGTSFRHARLANIFSYGSDFTNADFSGANLTGAIFGQANLSGANFSDANLTGAYINGATLTGANFTNAVLTSSQWMYLSFAGANLHGANIASAQFDTSLLNQATSGGLKGQPYGDLPQGCQLDNGWFICPDMSGVSFDNAVLPSADFQSVNLTGSSFQNASLAGASFAGAELTDAVLRNSDLSGTNFGNAAISNSRFDYSNLSGASFAGATSTLNNFTDDNLSGANFSNVTSNQDDFSGSRLTQANFENTLLGGDNLNHANAYGANFHNALLEYSTFEGANLDYADFSGGMIYSTSFKDASLKAATFAGNHVAETNVDSANIQNTKFKDVVLDGNLNGRTFGSPSSLPSGLVLQDGYFVSDSSAAPSPVLTDQWYTVGDTLEPETGYWDYNDTYQWFRDGVAISGATSSSYQTGARDVGHLISFQYTFTSNRTQTAVRVSNQVEVHATAPDQQIFASAPTPTVLGNVRVGSTLSAFAGAWDAGTSLSYQWSLDGSPISGATNANYVVGSTDFGHSISVSVTGAKTDFASLTKTSSTFEVGAGTLLTTPIPALSGGSNYGDTLTLQIVNDDYLAAETVQYKWYRCLSAITVNSSLPSGCLVIKNATDSTYTLQAADAGRYITGSVSATNSFGSITAYAIQSSITSRAPEFAVLPSILGTPKTGSLLVAANGSVAGYPDVSLAYQWYLCTTAVTGGVGDLPSGCSAITDATTSSYRVADSNAGKYITVVVTATNSVSSTSAMAKSRTATLQTLTLDSALSIQGNFSVGSSLTVVPGSFKAYPTPTETYKWYRCTNPVLLATSLPSGCTTISRAGQQSYVPVANDVGMYVTVAVTASSQGSPSMTVWAGQNVAVTTGNVLSFASVRLSSRTTSPKLSIRLVGQAKVGKRVSLLISGTTEITSARITWKIDGKTIKSGFTGLRVLKSYLGKTLTVEYTTKTKNSKRVVLRTKILLRK